MERPEAAPPSACKIVRFERRSVCASDSARSHPRRGSEGPDASPIAGFGRYERTEESDDYWHRQKANFAALLACVLLVVTGLWIAKTMADVQRDQHCVLSGGRNCAQISVTGVSKR